MINYFVIEDKDDLNSFDKIFPNLKNVCYILLSPNFLSFDKNLFKGRKYYYFDDKISFEESKTLAKTIDYYLWEWFLDEDGKDLSKLESCSIGSALVGSVDILLNTQFRYELGLKKILKKNSKLYYFSNCEKIFKITIPTICSKLNIENIELNKVNKKKTFSYGRLKINVSDTIGRYRDLAAIFRKNPLKDFALNLFLNKPVIQEKKKILYVQSGKLETFFSDIKLDPNISKNIVLYRSPKNMFDILFNNMKGNNFYFFSPCRNVNTYDTNEIVTNLKHNILKRFKKFEYSISLKLMENYIFPHFFHIFSFYKDVRYKLSIINPNLVILSADNHEYHILIAQAAKALKIKTAEIPHGMYNGGYSNLKVGNFKVFDFFFCFGDAGKKILRSLGVPEKNIRISSFPYFEKFMPIKKINKKNYTNCMILAPDYINISPSEKIMKYINYFENIIKLLKKKSIKLKGIKFRHEHSLILHKSILEKKFDNLNFFSGYKNLSHILDDVDLVIGPVSTAMIETNLQGIDYFPYENQKFYQSTPFFYKKMYKILNVSFTVDMLEKNIISKKTYKNNFSVQNLVYLRDFKSKVELYNHFIKTISSVI